MPLPVGRYSQLRGARGLRRGRLSVRFKREAITSCQLQVFLMTIFTPVVGLQQSWQPVKESRLMISRTATSHARALPQDANDDVESEGIEEMSQDYQSVSAKNNIDDITIKCYYAVPHSMLREPHWNQNIGEKRNILILIPPPYRN